MDDGKLNFQALLNDKNFQDGVKRVIYKTQEMGTTTEKVSKKSTSAFGALGKSLGGLSGVIKGVMASFGLLAGVSAIFSVIRNGARDVVAFDKSMTNMGAIAGKTRGDLKDLEKEIRKVAAESINTATSVADMATELIKLGTSTDGVKALLKPVNDLSIASQMSADATAVLLKGTLNAFQETEDQATRYADVMAKAIGSTALDAQKMGDAFSYIASTASVAGYSIEETSAMIGTLVDNNVQASSAGRVLSSVFGRLAKGGKELESELEKIRNSQDKLAQASKIFGAEGARLGVILANNKTKMAELTKEFENSAGSLSKLTSQQLESVSAKYAIMTSAWQEFVLSVENGSGIISKSIKGILDVLTTVLNGLAALNEYNPEAFKTKMMQGAGQAEIDRIKQYSKDYIDVRKKRLKSLGESYDAEREFNESTAYQLELATKKYNDEVVKQMDIDRRLTEAKQKNGKLRNSAIISEMEADKTLGEGRIKGLNAFISNLKGRTFEKPDTTNTSTEIGEDILKKRIALLDKIEKTERGLNESVLSDRESSTQKVLDKYIELNKEAVKLGMNTQKITDLQKQELEVVNYKADTNALKEELERRKELYTEFEKVKKDTSEQYAKEMYENLIDISKDYYDTLSDELDKIDTKDMTAKEKDRYNVLMKMLVDYGSDKSKQEREQLVKLFNDTKTTEQKILELREEYLKKRKSLEAEYSGVELDERSKELERQMKDDFEGLSNEMKSNAKGISDVTEMITGATRRQIEEQIKSLQNYINKTKDLTESQRESIVQMINSLQQALPTAQGESSSTQLSAVSNEYKNIQNQISELTKELDSYKDKNGKVFDEFAEKVGILNAKIDGLKSRLEDLDFEFLSASGSDIENLGIKFGELANSAGFAGTGIGSVLGSLGGIVRTTGSVLNSLGNIGKAFKDIGAQGGLGGVFQAGKAEGGFLGGLGAVSGAIAPIVAGVVALSSVMVNLLDGSSKALNRFAQKSREQANLSQLEQRRRQRELEAMSKNIPMVDYLNDQMDAMNNQIPKIQKEMDDLVNTLFDSKNIRLTSIEDRLAMAQLKNLYKNDMDAFIKMLEEVNEKNIFRNFSKETEKAILDLKKELDDLGVSIEDIKQQFDELMTGTNWQQMSNTFADMFANGTNDAIKFGETLEDVIRGAIVAGFKANYIDKEMQALFDNLAEISRDGELSQNEIDQFRKDAEQRFEYLNKTWEQLTSGLDIDFGEQLGDSARDSVKRITEQQADRLVGIATGIQVETIAIRNLTQNVYDAFLLSNNLLNSSIEQLRQIEANTRKTADNTSEISEKLSVLVGQKENNLNKSLGI